MKTFFLKDLSKEQVNGLCQRPAVDFGKIMPQARQILEDVKKQGDKAIKKYTKKFDGVDLDKFEVLKAEFKAADNVKPEVKKALKTAAKNIGRAWARFPSGFSK